jgi:5-methylphenazine-1-carboxylate 1-monooxygenase
MTVLIAGAGIGGLTMALSLHQIGIPAIVFESVPEIKPLGVGINLLPHAVREFTELGLQEILAENAIATSELAYFSKRGQQIWSEPRGRDAGYNWPQFSIHRGVLQMLLYEAVKLRLGADAIKVNHHLTSWRETGDEIEANFINRETGDPTETYKGDLLICADGVHSQARAILNPNEGAPIWNGSILWRGVTKGAPFLTGSTMIMAGYEFVKFVCYPIHQADNGDTLINWIAERKFEPDHEWRREDWNRPGKLSDFLPWFEDWRFDWLDVPALIQAAAHVYEYPMVDRNPLKQWSHGRMTLLGDAAHPMYPIGSNGASQAVLDARVLTREILHHGATPLALNRYDAERNPATAKIVRANRGNGPEQVMQMVEDRAPDGFENINDVLKPSELNGVATAYKKIAGFDRDALNQRDSIVAASSG